MAEIIQRPQLEWIGGRDPWMLVTPMIMYSDVIGDELVVPAGFSCDLASVPRVPFVYARYGNTAVLPAIVHDYMYSCTKELYTRKQADLLFYELMSLLNDPKRATQRWVMYKAVRGAGWLPWRRGDSRSC